MQNSTGHSILALDLGRQTGYCMLNCNGQMQWGSLRLQHETKTLRCCVDLKRRLESWVNIPEIVCWERTYAQGWAGRILCGLETIVEVFCMERQIKHYVVTPTQWKKQLLGRAHASQTEYLQWVNQSYSVVNADAAAALCIAAYIAAREGIMLA